MHYDHTQTAPLYLFLVVTGIVMLAAGCLANQLIAQIALLASGGLLCLSALCFRQLSVRHRHDHLLVCFGPLTLFRRRVRYDDIQSVVRSRTTLLDGWGIHVSPRGGWTWNLWGFDCVELTWKKGGRLRIGTDDAEQLAAFIGRCLEQRGV